MPKQIHIPQHEQQRQIREGIALQGFALRHVLASESEPAFSYTVGLHTPGSTTPELLISGLKIETRVAWLLDLGFRIQGPPKLSARQQMARAHGVPLRSLVFPSGGEVFVPGKRYCNLAGAGLPTLFATVAPEHYDAHLGQAIVFHRTSAFPVLQVVWPDTCGSFPWEDLFEQRFQGRQRLLFEPSRLPEGGNDA